MSPFHLVEQIGDCTFPVPDHEYPTEAEALIALVELDDRYAAEDREFFIDSPSLAHPIGVGRQRPTAS